MADEQYNVILNVQAEGDDQLRQWTQMLASVQQEAKLSTAQLRAMGDQAAASSKQGADGLAVMQESLEKAGHAVETFRDLWLTEQIVEAIGEIKNKIGETIESIGGLVDTSKKLGISTENLSVLKFAASQTGTSFDAVTNAVTRLSKNIADVTGKGGPAVDFLRALGITAGTDAYTALEKLAGAFNALPNPMEKAALAILEFGKGGAGTVNLLNVGAQGLADLATEAEKLNVIIDQQTAQRIKELDDQLQAMKAVSQGLVVQLVTGLEPSLSAIAKTFLDTAESSDKTIGGMSAMNQIVIALAASLIEAGGQVRLFVNDLEYVFNITKNLVIALYDFGSAIAAIANRALGLTNNDQMVASLKATGAQFVDQFAQMNSAGLKFQNTFTGVVDSTDKQLLLLQKNVAATQAALAKGLKAPPAEGGGAVDPKAKAAAEAAVAAARAQAEGARAAKASKAAAEREKQAIAESNRIKKMWDAVTEGASKEFEQHAKESGKGVTDAYDQQRAALDKLADSTERALDPSIAYNETIAQLNTLLKAHKISQEAYDLAQQKASATQLAALEALGATVPAVQQADKAIKDHADQVQSMTDSWAAFGKASADALAGMVTGSMKAKDAVKQLLTQLLEVLAKQAVLALFGGSKAGSFGASLVKSFSAKGNIFGPAGLVPFANGGVVSAPTLFPFANGVGMMGEAGPEAIMPLQRDNSGKLGVASAPVHVSVINNAGAAISVADRGNGQIDVIVARAVEASRSAIALDLRRGGTAVSRSIERTYGVNRSAGAY
jgi:lambda family phage tail tape measure protein